jgi:hypothetical protein
MIHFLTIKINEKGQGEDYRAFLTFADSDTMMAYEIRGYGNTPGSAADDAYTRYAGPDRETFISDQWDWK